MVFGRGDIDVTVLEFDVRPVEALDFEPAEAGEETDGGGGGGEGVRHYVVEEGVGLGDGENFRRPTFRSQPSESRHSCANLFAAGTAFLWQLFGSRDRLDRKKTFFRLRNSLTLSELPRKDSNLE